MRESFTAFSVMAAAGITGWVIADWPGLVATITALIAGTAALAAADEPQRRRDTTMMRVREH